MAVTQAQLEAERDAVFTEMTTLRANPASYGIRDRSLVNQRLGELRAQFEWLEKQIAMKANTNRTTVVAFREAG